jgi:hypothetical protein
MRAIIVVLAVLLAPAAWAGERVELPGFSFERPGAPWRQRAFYGPRSGDIRRERYMAHYAADDGVLSTAFVDVNAWLEPEARGGLQAALDWLKGQFEAAPKAASKRFTYTAHEMKEVKIGRATCAYWHSINEDRGVPRHEGDVYITVINTYYCPHPDNPAYIIALMYSTRLAPGAAPFTKDSDLDSLAQSLGFNTLN